MLREISPNLFREWRAYHSIEPWGWHGQNWLQGNLAAVMASPYRPSWRAPFEPEDFMLEFAPAAKALPQVQSDEELKMNLMAWAGAHGGMAGTPGGAN